MQNNKKIFLFFCLLSLAGCMTVDKDQESSKVSMKNASSYNVQLGLKYAQSDQLPRAKQKLTLALQQDPRSPGAHAAMGYYLETVKDLNEAEEHYKRAISLGPAQGSWANNYGTFLCRQGRFTESEKYFKRAIDDPEYLKVADAYENLGLCSLKAGEMPKSKEYFIKAIAHSDNTADAHLELADIYFHEGKFTTALKHIDKYHQYAVKNKRSDALSTKINSKVRIT